MDKRDLKAIHDDLIAKHKERSEKTQFNLYLSKALVDEFIEHCGALRPVDVVEELLKRWIESTPKGPKPAKATKKRA